MKARSTDPRRREPAELVGEYLIGRRQVPVDCLGPAVPKVMIRANDTTQPLQRAESARRRGPSTDELERLGTGEFQAALRIAGRYRLDRRLGRGGMATVFLGEHLGLGRRVAIKVLSDRHPDRHHAMARFLREARLSARIRHENIVEVFDFGSTPEGVVYLVMELLEGEDLCQTIARHPTGLPWARVRHLMLQICAGLAAAHRQGIIHRDLKPSNCFRVPDGDGEQIKLVDFGIATLTRAAQQEEDDLERGDRITGTGTIVGTPEYMSPEQARGDEVDVRSDVYAAGVIMGELLTGKVPFTGKSKTAVIAAQIYEQPCSLQAMAEPGVRVDARVQAIFTRALAKDPQVRFASIEALAAAIAAVPADGPVLISGRFDAVTEPIAPEASEEAGAGSGGAGSGSDRAKGRASKEPRESWWRRSWRIVAAAALAAAVASAATLAMTSRPAKAEGASVEAGSVAEASGG